MSYIELTLKKDENRTRADRQKRLKAWVCTIVPAVGSMRTNNRYRSYQRLVALVPTSGTQPANHHQHGEKS
ncbi:MAG: hypothetical protein SPI30_10960 [Prevotella sp.]|nr:hypothetical protein [Prevotella sp.]